MFVEMVITPTGRLRCDPLIVSPGTLEARVAVEPQLGTALCEAFSESTSRGLMALSGRGANGVLPLDLQFWRRWVLRFFKSVGQLTAAEIATVHEAVESRRGKPISAAIVARLSPPNPLELAAFVAEAPLMWGLEYLTPELLTGLWNELIPALGAEAGQNAGGFRGLLAEVIPNFHLLGRVTFHLAENKRDPDHPFAFLATYAERLSSKSQVQHLPLGAALRQYAAAQDQAKLAELLTPVRDAAAGSPVVGQLLSSREVFQPQAWTVAQAHRFLTEIPAMEQAGLAVRVPDWWKARREARPQVQVRIGEQPGDGLGLTSLLDFSAILSIDGTPLTPEEQDSLLAATDGLALLRGRWVEIDARKLTEALQHWRDLEAQHAEGISFLEGMRLLAGATADGTGDATAEWTSLGTGTWLEDVLRRLRSPDEIEGCEPGTGLNATLRPYQADGVRWLWFMLRLGLGACLADDMGLGKTIQVIDLMLRLRGADPASKQATGESAPAGLRSGPCLLVVPASLVGNWKGELEKFAPQLRVCLAHRSELDAESLAQIARNPTRQLARKPKGQPAKHIESSEPVIVEVTPGDRTKHSLQMHFPSRFATRHGGISVAVTSRAVGCSRLSNRGSDWGGHPPLWRCRAWIGGMSRRRPLEPELGWNRTTPQASLSRGHRDRPTDFAALGVRWSRSRRRVFLLAVLLACREAASRCMVSSRELLTTGCDVSFDRPAHRVRSPETVPWLTSLHLTPPDLRGGSLDPPRSTAPPSRPFRTMTPDLIQSPDRGWMSLFMTTP